jgi:hypothetical protein
MNIVNNLRVYVGPVGSQPGNPTLENLQRKLHKYLSLNSSVVITVDGRRLIFRYEFGHGYIHIPLTDEEIELINKLWEGEDKLFV